ncbi:MAG: o-succinylbenzoate synthase [Lentimicrobiaceae bacterium]
MLLARYAKYTLHFKQPAGTSRGVLTEKTGYILEISNSDQPGITGSGECSILPELSYDDRPGYEERLQQLCDEINLPFHVLMAGLTEWPSLQFALETALLHLKNGGSGLLFESSFTDGRTAIPINGLIWMSDYETMLAQIKVRIASGFKVIKMKVGALDFGTETELLTKIRQQYPPGQITLRLDANGAFSRQQALEKLHLLSAFQIHSIEQPIQADRTNHWASMAYICRHSPIPVALDEELIGYPANPERIALLEAVSPSFIILKPSLLGGFSACAEWIRIAESRNIGWWVTSALESNIGLSAIAQWTATLPTKGMAQGLGTGSLFTDNFESPLHVEQGELKYK